MKLKAPMKLPRPGRCKYIDEDGTLCQRRRDGKSWCPEHRQIVTEQKNPNKCPAIEELENA
jgi:hypothetical protein